MSAANTSSNVSHFSNVSVGSSGGSGVITLNGTDITATATEINAAADVSGGGVVNIGVGTPYTVLAANTGRPHVIPDMTGNSAINLPTAAAGLDYTFYYVGGAADAHDHTVDTGSDTNFFIGGISFLDTDAGDAADEVHVGIFSDGDSNSIMTLNNLTAGSWFRVMCDGTNWYVTGQILSDTVPSAMADQ